MLSHGRGKDKELTCEHPEWGHTKDCQRSKHQAPPNRRTDSNKSTNSIHLLSASGLRRVPGGEKDGRLGKRVNRHVEQSGEIGNGPTQAERKRDDAHVLDGRIT